MRQASGASEIRATQREKAAFGYIESINANNRSAWLERVPEFAKMESDDLTTRPVFHTSLDLLAQAQSDLM